MANPPLLHPVALVALVVLVVNDHWLKAVAPGPVTGKLSDVAGLVVFPLLLAELIGAGARLAGHESGSRARRVAIAAGLTAGVFAAVKTTGVGAVAYAWGLGTVQWLLAGAWLRGEAPLPVAIAQDPTDLLAIPTVLLAVWVALPRKPRSSAGIRSRHRLAGPAVALLAGVASIATSQAAPTAHGTATQPVPLDAGHPVAAFAADWSMAVEGDAGYAWFQAVARNGEQDGLPPGIELVLVPEVPPGPLEGTSAEARTIPLECQGSCTGSALVVVRALPEALDGDPPLDLRVEASAFASLPSESQASSSVVAVDLVPDPNAVQGHALIAGAVDGVVVASAERAGVVRIEVLVDAAALEGARAWPLVGRIELEVRTVGHPAVVPSIYGELAGVPEPAFLMHGVPVVVDWLAACPAEDDCRIPLEFSVSAELDEEGRPVEVRVAWTAEARLEAFDGRSLPEDAIRIGLP